MPSPHMSLEVAVAVEAVIHDALCKALELVAEKHGVIVEKVRIKWDPSPVGFSIRRIDITSFTIHEKELKDESR